MITTKKTKINFKYKQVLYNNGWTNRIHKHSINGELYQPNEIPEDVKSFINRCLKKHDSLNFKLVKENNGFTEAGNPWVAKYYESQELDIEAYSISPYIIEWFK